MKPIKVPNENRPMPDEDFWNTRWKKHQTGWDIGYPSPPITSYMDQFEDKAASVLIPGCGNAWEAEYLADRGFTDITLLDISSEAVRRLQNKFSGRPEIKVIHKDFFKHTGQYDLLLEQTFFCAISPVLRKDYVRQAASLLRIEGEIIGVLFDTEFGRPGPPFGGHSAEYEKIFASHFDIRIMESCYNSIPSRAGSEIFIRLINKNGADR